MIVPRAVRRGPDEAEARGAEGPIGSGGVGVGPLQQAVDLGPQGLPRLPLGLGAGPPGPRGRGRRRGRGPAASGGASGRRRRGPPGRRSRGPPTRRPARLVQPVEGLAAEFGPRRVVGLRVVLALAGGGQGGGAGGVVGVLGLAGFGQRRVGLQRLGPEPRGGGVPLRLVGPLGQVEPLGVVLRGLAVQDRGQPGVEGGEEGVGGVQLGQPALGLGRQVGVVQAIGRPSGGSCSGCGGTGGRSGGGGWRPGPSSARRSPRGAGRRPRRTPGRRGRAWRGCSACRPGCWRSRATRGGRRRAADRIASAASYDARASAGWPVSVEAGCRGIVVASRQVALVSVR